MWFKGEKHMKQLTQYRFKYEEIIKYLKENNMSKTAFCKLCNISMYTLNELLKGRVLVNAFAGFRVSEVLNINLMELVVEIN